MFTQKQFRLVQWSYSIALQSSFRLTTQRDLQKIECLEWRGGGEKKEDGGFACNCNPSPPASTPPRPPSEGLSRFPRRRGRNSRGWCNSSVGAEEAPIIPPSCHSLSRRALEQCRKPRNAGGGAFGGGKNAGWGRGLHRWNVLSL